MPPTDIVKQALAGNIQLSSQFGSAFETGMKVAQAAEQARMQNEIQKKNIAIEEEKLKFEFEKRATDLMRIAFAPGTNSKLRKSLIDSSDSLFQRAGKKPFNPEFKEMLKHDPTIGQKLVELAEAKKQAMLDPNNQEKAKRFGVLFDNMTQMGYWDADLLVKYLNEALKSDVQTIGPLTKREEKPNIISGLKSQINSLLSAIRSGESGYVPDELSQDIYEKVMMLPDGADEKDPAIKALLTQAAKNLQRDNIKIAEGNIERKKEERLKQARDSGIELAKTIYTAPFITNRINSAIKRLQNEQDVNVIYKEIIPELSELKRIGDLYHEGKEDQKVAVGITENINKDIREIQKGYLEAYAFVRRLESVQKNPTVAAFQEIKPMLSRLNSEKGPLQVQEQRWASLINNLEALQNDIDSWLGKKWDRQASQEAQKALADKIKTIKSTLSQSYADALGSIHDMAKNETGNRYFKTSYEQSIKPVIISQAVQNGILSRNILSSMTYEQKLKAFKNKALKEKGIKLSDKDAAKALDEYLRQIELNFGESQ
jgi:hypothetical protein